MILIIKNYGWRSMYFISGTAGVILLAITIFLVKNPSTIFNKQEEQQRVEEESREPLNINSDTTNESFRGEVTQSDSSIQLSERTETEQIEE